MTKIIVKKRADGCYQSFECIGHAGYADSGSDIVCAAISILVINTINSLETLAKEDMQYTENSAKGRIQCIFQQPLSEGGVLLMDAMLLGLSFIKKQYGKKYLNVKIKEV